MDKGQWYITGALLGGALFGGLAYLLGANNSNVYFISIITGIVAGKITGWYVGKSREEKLKLKEDE